MTNEHQGHEHNKEHHRETKSHHRTEKTISWTNIILLISVGVLLFGFGYKYGQVRAANPTTPSANSMFGNVFEPKKSEKASKIDFVLFWDVWNKVEQKFVDDSKIDATKMYYGAIKGMVASLEDPYTFFLTPEENKKSKDDLGGKFDGIGAQLGLREGLIVIVAPLKNSPALKAGILSGDILYKVDGESVQGWTLNQAVSKIRGERGTVVKITIIRNSDEKTFDITRDQIKVDSVELSYENGSAGQVAIIKVNQFGESTNSEWDAAVSEVNNRYAGGQIKGLVLDLRDNPGGYLESSVYLASEFLPVGSMVVKQESTVDGNKEYKVRRTGRLMDIPMTVLINQGSASASEILSGALRDYDRATIIGEKSFGKGSVQEALDLSKGAGLHVTVAKWILPKGEWINGKGIMPQIEVKNELEEGNTLTRESDQQLNRAVEEVFK